MRFHFVGCADLSAFLCCLLSNVNKPLGQCHVGRSLTVLFYHHVPKADQTGEAIFAVMQSGENNSAIDRRAATRVARMQWGRVSF